MGAFGGEVRRVQQHVKYQLEIYQVARLRRQRRGEGGALTQRQRYGTGESAANRAMGLAMGWAPWYHDLGNDRVAMVAGAYLARASGRLVSSMASAMHHFQYTKATVDARTSTSVARALGVFGVSVVEYIVHLVSAAPHQGTPTPREGCAAVMSATLCSDAAVGFRRP